jgi:hypothetical protein
VKPAIANAEFAIRHSPRPLQCLLEPVVAPKQLAVGAGEARRAEHPQPLRRLGLRPQTGLDRIGLRGGEGACGIDLQLPEQFVHGGGVIDSPAVAELRAEHGEAEVLAPAGIETDQGDARCQQA